MTGNMEGLRLMTVLSAVMVATVITATPLPPTGDDRLTSGDKNTQGQGIDIGLEIHKLHLRMSARATDAKKEGVEKGYRDEGSVVKNDPTVNRSENRDVQEIDRMDSPLTSDNTSNWDALEKELENVEYPWLTVELDELIPFRSTDVPDVVSDLLGLDDELALTESPRTTRQESTERSPSETDLGSGSSGLDDELQLLHPSGMPSQDSREPSRAENDMSSGFLGMEDELAHQESSGSSFVDSVDLPSIEMSSVVEDLPSALRHVHDQTMAEQFSSDSPVDGSGSGESSNGDFLEFGLALNSIDEFVVSDLGIYEGNTKDPDDSDESLLSGDGGQELSGSGLSSGDDSENVGFSAEQAYKDITLSNVSPPGIGVQSMEETPQEDLEVNQEPKDLDSQVGEAHSKKTTQAKTKGKKGAEGVSVEERLELELEGLTVVVSETVSIEDDEEDGEQLAPSTESSKDYVIPPVSTSKPSMEPVSQGSRAGGCMEDETPCSNGVQCVPIESTCDLVQDCSDGSDEVAELCEPSRKCETGFFKCGGSAQCISQAGRCDGIYQCYNGEDEKGCTSCLDPHGRQNALTVEDICDGVQDCEDGSDERRQRCELPCPSGYRKCRDDMQCVKEKLFCNGVRNCRDESDETACDRTSSECLAFGMFACDGLCLPRSALCDYTYDCNDGSDEDGCQND